MSERKESVNERKEGRKERPNKKIWYNKVHQITRESTDISLENFLLEKFFFTLLLCHM